MEKHYIYISIMIVVMALLLVLLYLKTEKFSMTLGNYGHPEPAFCKEEEPNVRFKNIYVCNACNLSCSTKESWDSCQKCMSKLNNIIPAVL